MCKWISIDMTGHDIFLQPTSAFKQHNMNLLPQKSKQRYLGEYSKYLQWLTKNGHEPKTESEHESTLFSYLQQLKLKYKESTLCTMCSMIRSVLLMKQKLEVSISRIKRLLNSNKTKTKKAKCFTEEEINTYLRNEKSSGQALVTKLILVFGLYGALRVSELAALKFEHVEYHHHPVKHLKVNITQSKTDKSEQGFFFIIPERSSGDLNCPVKLFHQYRNQIEKATGRRFRYFRNGKFSNNVIGVHSVALVPRMVATFLKLKNSNEYTGHTLRRTSATFLANQGISMPNLKRIGRWKSTTVAQGYLDQSTTRKLKGSKMIEKSLTLNTKTQTSSTVVNNYYINNSVVNMRTY